MIDSAKIQKKSIGFTFGSKYFRTFFEMLKSRLSDAERVPQYLSKDSPPQLGGVPSVRRGREYVVP
jgi:hypothetical protein